MNYGYGSYCPHWNENKKNVLAEQLCTLLEDLGFIDVYGYQPSSDPYIEVDGSYGGVRIRRITNMSESKQKELIRKADQIYLEIMHD